MTRAKKPRTFELHAPWRRPEVHRVELPSTVTPLPETCANCGADAARSLREQRGAHTSMVPYCSRCAAGVEAAATRVFAATLSSLLVAVTLLLTLPRLWPTERLFAYWAVAVLGACVPLVVVAVLRPRRKEGQTASGRAAFFSEPKTLACTRAEFASELAALAGTTSRPGFARPPLPKGFFSGPVLALALAPLSYGFQHPEVVVLNLGAEPFELWVDGARVTRVDVTSLESPNAGTRLRLASGERRFTLRSADGRTLVEERLGLHAGRTHLYAPFSGEQCFWMEQETYGRTPKAKTRYRALPEGRFWTLPEDVDSWFSENPETSNDDRSTGGTLLALRHARCAEAPSEVR